MLTKRRVVDARATQLAVYLIGQVNALASERAALRRELARRDNELQDIIASHQEERAANQEFREAVERRRAAEEEIVRFYRDAYHAQHAAPGEMPRPRWLH
jgi:hypothetical protein